MQAAFGSKTPNITNGYQKWKGETMPETNELLKVASNAAAMIGAFYEHLDRVNAAGGPTCISGIASCAAMVKSLNNNRERAEKLIMKPLREAIEKAS